MAVAAMRSNTHPRILLIGGSGKVGQLIAEEIHRLCLGVVTIAGRTAAKAMSAAERIDRSVRWAIFDINSFGTHEQLLIKESDLVIVCIDQHDLHWVSYCIEHRVMYLDITAKTDFINSLPSLHEKAVMNDTLVLTGLGLCPGITTLLAAQLTMYHPEADAFNTGLMLGLGEAHGKASIEWTLDNYLNDFKLRGEMVRSFWHHRSFYFGRKSAIKAYRFNFSDQHTLTDGHYPNVYATYLCFDSAVTTRLFYFFKRLGIDRLLKKPFFRTATIGLFSALTFGSKGFSCESSALRAGKVIDTLRCSGVSTNHATAAVVIAAIMQLRSTRVSGVRDIRELLTLEKLKLLVSSRQIIFHE
jgi:saccharopine dehydrogenase (NAD+, L-lysine-forming)